MCSVRFIQWFLTKNIKEKTGDLKFRLERTGFRFTQCPVSSGFTVPHKIAISACRFINPPAASCGPLAWLVSKKFLWKTLYPYSVVANERSPKQCLDLYWLEHPSVNSCITSTSYDIESKYCLICCWAHFVKLWSCCKSGDMTNTCTVIISGKSSALSKPSYSKIACLFMIVTCKLHSVRWK